MSYLGFLPIALVLVSASAFCFSYIIAVIRGDVRAAFPYISDTGAEVPESCVFGQFLNIAAFLSFCTMYLRFKAVQAIAGHEDRWLRRMNKGTMFLGFVSSFGCSMVANFQEGTVVQAVHVIGATLTFIGGLTYCFLQTRMSYHMYPDYNGLFICRVRLAVSLVSCCCLVMTCFKIQSLHCDEEVLPARSISASFPGSITAIIAAGIALHAWGDFDIKDKDKFKWGPDQPGYAAHVVSTIGEWLTALTFLGFFFSYVREFHKFNLEVQTRPLVRHLDEDPFVEPIDERTPLL